MHAWAWPRAIFRQSAVTDHAHVWYRIDGRPSNRHYGRRRLPRVSNTLGKAPKQTLGEGFPECNTRGRPSGDASHGEAFHKGQATSRGQFNTIDVISFFTPLPRVQHSGKKFLFFGNLFPECNTLGRILFFLKNSSLSACPRHSGKTDGSFFYIPSSPSAAAQALGEATFFLQELNEFTIHSI
jgi:hypothetical protein